MDIHPLGENIYTERLIMKQQLYPKGIVRVDSVVGIEDGGTGATVASRAAQNLGMITKSQVGRPLGPIPVEEATGKIPLRFFTGVARYRAEVDGEQEVLPNVRQVFDITNFDSRLEYEVVPVNGTVTREEDKINYTPPSNRRLPVGFKLNGETWPLQFKPNIPWNPNYAKGDILDRKLFILRQSKEGGMYLSFNGDFTKLNVGEPNSTSDGVTLSGSVEKFNITPTSLNKEGTLYFKTPSFKVEPILGVKDGRYYSNSDVPGWTVDSEETDVPEGSTFFEMVVKGGLKHRVTLSPSGSGDSPNSSSPSNFLHDHLFINAAQKLGKYDLLSGYSNGSSWPAGIDTGPQTFVINSQLSYYFPIPGRLPFPNPSYPAFRLRYSNGELVGVDLIDAKITLEYKSNRAYWEDIDPVYAGSGLIIGTWGEERFDTFEMDAPGIDSFATLGDVCVHSKGQGLTNDTVVVSKKKIFTRENVRYGNIVLEPRGVPDVRFTSGNGKLNYLSKHEFLEIQRGSERKLIYSSTPELSTGFGCFIASPDSGGVVIVGEQYRDQVYVYSLDGDLLRVIVGPRQGSEFGTSGDISPNGSLLAVGAPKEDNGVVYVYRDWLMVDRIETPLSDEWSFGHCVKITRDGNRLFVSARHKTNGTGRVVIFRLTLGEWIYENILDGYDAIGFGASLSLSDDSFICLVGAPGNSSIDGEAQIWTEGDLGWDLQVKLIPGENIKGGSYGESVLISPDGTQAFVLAPKLQTSSDSFGRLYYFK